MLRSMAQSLSEVMTYHGLQWKPKRLEVLAAGDVAAKGFELLQSGARLWVNL